MSGSVLKKKNLLEIVAFNNFDKLDKTFFQNNAESILKKDFLVDPARRQFKSISPLQYTAWTLNSVLLNELINFLNSEQKDIALEQLNELNKHGSEYGCYYDFHTLYGNFQKYIENFKQWDVRQIIKEWQSLQKNKSTLLPLHIKNKYINDSKSLQKNYFQYATPYSLFYRYLNSSTIKRVFWDFILFIMFLNFKNNLYWKTNNSFQSLSLMIEPTWSIGKFAKKDLDDLQDIYLSCSNEKQEIIAITSSLVNNR